MSNTSAPAHRHISRAETTGALTEHTGMQRIVVRRERLEPGTRITLDTQNPFEQHFLMVVQGSVRLTADEDVEELTFRDTASLTGAYRSVTVVATGVEVAEIIVGREHRR